jgi:hypothetical protein
MQCQRPYSHGVEPNASGRAGRSDAECVGVFEEAVVEASLAGCYRRT